MGGGPPQIPQNNTTSNDHNEKSKKEKNKNRSKTKKNKDPTLSDLHGSPLFPMFLLRSQPVICEADHFKWYDYSCSCSDDDDDALADTWSTINASGNDACSRDGSGSSKSVASSSTSMLLVVILLLQYWSENTCKG